MPLFKNPKKYGELHKKWSQLKKAAETELKDGVKDWVSKTVQEIKEFEKNPGTAVERTGDVDTAINEFKQARVDYLDTVFESINCDRKKSESPSFGKLFPDFDKGFGGKLDAYEKAAEKGAKDTEKKRSEAEKIAEKYKDRIKAKLPELKKFGLDRPELKKCQTFLEKFCDGDEEEALKV